MTRACVDAITELIAALRLGEGDRLPGERDLAQRIGCSRNTVREALVALAAEGRLEIRGRSGCYVSAAGPSDSWRLLRETADAGSALDVLRAIGPHVVARAAQRCGAEPGRRLEILTARLGRFLVNREAAATVREFVTFFVVLAGLAENPYLELLAREVAASRSLPNAIRDMDKSRVEAFFALHVSLLQAIRGHDVRRAVTLEPQCLDAFSAMLGGDRAEMPQRREGAA